MHNAQSRKCPVFVEAARKHDWDIREDGEYSGERWTCWNCRLVCDPRITSQKGMKEQLREEACPGRP